MWPLGLQSQSEHFGIYCSFQIWDSNVFCDTFLGQAKMTIDINNRTVVLQHQLRGRKRQHNETMPGAVTLEIGCYHDLIGVQSRSLCFVMKNSDRGCSGQMGDRCSVFYLNNVGVTYRYAIMTFAQLACQNSRRKSESKVPPPMDKIKIWLDGTSKINTLTSICMNEKRQRLSVIIFILNRLFSMQARISQGNKIISKTLIRVIPTLSPLPPQCRKDWLH